MFKYKLEILEFLELLEKYNFYIHLLYHQTEFIN